MEQKDRLTTLMSWGLSLDDAMEIINSAGTPDLEDQEPEQQPEQEPEEQPEQEETQPAVDLAGVTAAIDDLKKTIQSLMDVTRANARLFGRSERNDAESAEDILSKLG